MVGLIWVIQIVHYPLFSRVGIDHFVAYERDHSRMITWIVAPLMLAELSTGVGLIYFWMKAQSLVVGINSVLLAMIWISTFAIQVPLHQKLESGFDRELHRRLVSTNWIRTVCWSLRGALLLSIATEVL